MNRDEQLQVIWNIINLCSGGLCLLGHVDFLVRLEDHPATKGLDGILASIREQAAALEKEVSKHA